MKNKKKIFTSLLLAISLLNVGTLTGCGSSNQRSAEYDYTQPVEITNVSYDPTRELYEA